MTHHVAPDGRILICKRAIEPRLGYWTLPAGFLENEETVQEGRYYRLERAYGHFQRNVTLPQGVKADEISASFDNGVLSVRVPKAEEVRPRKIAVEAGAPAADGADTA